MIKYNENAIYLIGGKQNDKWSNKTWIIDPKNGYQIREGPSLNNVRHSHGCAKMVINNRVLLVVTGGLGTSHTDFLNTVEILDPLSHKGWLLGKYIALVFS